MNIGFDFDKIFVDYPPFIPDKLIDALYKEKSNGVLSYRIPSKPEQFFRLLTHLPPFRPPIVANIEFVINPSRKNDHKYYIISSRFSFLKGRTKAIIKKYEFKRIFDGMFFNFEDEQPHIFKELTLRRLKIDRYVDDDLPLLRFLASRNPTVDFYWLNEAKTEAMGKNLFAIVYLSAIMQ